MNADEIRDLIDAAWDNCPTQPPKPGQWTVCSRSSVRGPDGRLYWQLLIVADTEDELRLKVRGLMGRGQLPVKHSKESRSRFKKFPNGYYYEKHVDFGGPVLGDWDKVRVGS